MAEYDVVVIGAGHNGLVNANYLAKSGLKVICVEKNQNIGGGCSTEEVTLPGFKHNLHSTFHGWLPMGPVYKDLNLENYVNYVYPPANHVSLFDNNRSLVVYRSMDQVCKQIAQFSEKDAVTYRRIFKSYKEFIDTVFVPWFFSPPVNQSDLIATLEKSPEGMELYQWMMSTPMNIYNELFESDELKNHLMARVLILGMPHDYYGSGLIAIFAIIKVINPICVGGSRNLAEGLARLLKEQGGEVINNTPVEKIIVKDGAAVGVKTAGGKEIMARKAVVSNIEPKQTMLGMVGPDKLDEWYVSKVNAFKPDAHAIFGVHYALNDAPKYTHAEKNPDVNMGFSQDIFGNKIEDFTDFFADVRRGIPPRKPAFQCCSPTVHDPTQAPPGKHTAFIWQPVPYNLRGKGPEGWADIAEEYADYLQSIWQEYAPNISGSNILGRFVHDPLKAMQYNNNFIGGGFNAGDMSPDQMGNLRPIVNWAQYRTPIKNLYMCGCSNHPGGSVSGSPGYCAAGIIHDDLGIKRWWKGLV